MEDRLEVVNTKLRQTSKSTSRTVCPLVTWTGPERFTLMPVWAPLGTFTADVAPPPENSRPFPRVTRPESTSMRSWV